METAERRQLEVWFQAACARADWNLARAAACPWWAPWRRWILLHRAEHHVWEAEPHAELLLDAEIRKALRA